MITKLLIKKFIKDKDSVKDPKVRNQYGNLASVTGIITNLTLALSKVIIGIITGGISVIADGINNLTDASSSIITFIGFKISERPGDADHPYGHARSEYIAGMIVSILVAVVGIELFRSSVEKIINPEEIKFKIITIVILILSILIKLWQSKFYNKIGKKIDSIAIMATGTDSRNDVITTAAVLLVLMVYKLTSYNLDGYVGCFIALFIIKSGIGLVKETASPLLGEAPDSEMVKAIEEKSLSYNGVLGIHDLVVHNYGPGKIFASIHIEVDADSDLMESHDIIDQIERDTLRDLQIELTGHLDPIKVNDPLTDSLNSLLKDIIDDIPEVHIHHDLRIVPGTTHTNVIFDLPVLDTCKKSHKDIQSLIESRVKEEYPTFNLVINFEQTYVRL